MSKNTQTTAEAIEKIKQQEEYGKYVKKNDTCSQFAEKYGACFFIRWDYLYDRTGNYEYL